MYASVNKKFMLLTHCYNYVKMCMHLKKNFLSFNINSLTLSEQINRIKLIQVCFLRYHLKCLSIVKTWGGGGLDTIFIVYTVYFVQSLVLVWEISHFQTDINIFFKNSLKCQIALSGYTHYCQTTQF